MRLATRSPQIEHQSVLDTKPGFSQTLPPQGPPFSFPAEFKKYFERTAQGFWRALKHTASDLSISSIPWRTRAIDHFSSGVKGITSIITECAPSILSACLLWLAGDSSTVASLE
jgi:hypothetical protein